MLEGDIQQYVIRCQGKISRNVVRRGENYPGELWGENRFDVSVGSVFLLVSFTRRLF